MHNGCLLNKFVQGGILLVQDAETAAASFN